MPSGQKMKPPKKGGTPKTIKQKMEEKPGGFSPGGPQTPGAKKKRKKDIKDGSAEGHKLTGMNQ